MKFLFLSCLTKNKIDSLDECSIATKDNQSKSIMGWNSVRAITGSQWFEGNEKKLFFFNYNDLFWKKIYVYSCITFSDITIAVILSFLALQWHILQVCMSLQTKENYFIYLSSFRRTVYIEIEELKEWQMVISMDIVFTIGGFLFSTHFFFSPTMKAQDIWMSLSLECHISFLKQDRIVVRALGSWSTPCNKSSVSKLQLSKPQKSLPCTPRQFCGA